jgi:hypothetical protein
LSKSEQELFEKFKRMPLRDLEIYRVTVNTLDAIFGAIGVGMLMLMMAYTGLVTVIPGGIIVYVLSEASAGLGKVRQEIRIQVQKRLATGDK